MSNAFTPPDGPFTGHPGLGFGFGPGHGPGQRRALHGARRQARREFFENLRDQAGDQTEVLVSDRLPEQNGL